MELLEHKLDNGIRLVHKQVPNIIAHCGLIINSGSRDELENEHGVAHFIEHMLFKGTKKRKPFHILSRLEDRGGELNAYTTKEETTIYASFLKEDYNIALELIYDITFNSTFPAKEIKKEKEVINEEINSYKDSPSELIFDDFEELIFPGDPIGRNILGTPRSVNSITKATITEFIARNYNTYEMVVSSVGNISGKRIIALFEKHFSQIPANRGCQNRIKQKKYKADYRIIKKDTWQNHCIIGNIAFDLKNKKRIGMHLLNNILGGQGLNSRLNLSLREKNGFAYNVESNYHPYYDTGLFQIYFGTESENLEKSIQITLKEVKRLRDVKLGNIQLHRAKKQIKGILARAYENHESYMLSMGKSLLVYNRVDPVSVINSKIDSITADNLLEIANEVFCEKEVSTLIYK